MTTEQRLDRVENNLARLVAVQDQMMDVLGMTVEGERRIATRTERLETTVREISDKVNGLIEVVHEMSDKLNGLIEVVHEISDKLNGLIAVVDNLIRRGK